MKGGRVLAAMCATLATGLCLAAPPQASADDTDFGPTPPRGDCRDYAVTCTNDARTGETKVSPRIIKEGESISVSFSLLPGGVSFVLPTDARDCSNKTESRKVETQNAAGTWVLEDKDVSVAQSCTLKPGSTHGKWATISVPVTGPCGSQIAVQQGKAEYAACAGTYDSDYFGVIGKDDDRWAISGRLALSNGRGMVGVPVHLSGPDSKTAVTSATGDYYFLVKKGSYTIRPDAKVCVTPVKAGSCRSSATVTVGGSKSVNFGPESEGTIDGTIRDAGGDPVPGVTVRVLGPEGESVTTDGNGAYSVRVPKGTYTMVASKLMDTDAAGKPVVPPKVLAYCAARTGTGTGSCLETPTVKVPPDQTVDWTPKEDPGLLVALDGDKGVQHGFVRVTFTLSNPRKVPIKDIVFQGDSGLVLTPLGDDGKASTANPPPDLPVLLNSGPTPTLPTTLAPQASLKVSYRFVARAVGEAGVAVKVSGSTPDGTKVRAYHAGVLSVSDRDITQDDIDRAVVGGLQDVIDMVAQGQQSIDEQMGKNWANSSTITNNSDPGVTAAQVTAAQELGLPKTMGSFVKESVNDQLDYLGTFGDEFIKAVDRDGQAGGKLLYEGGGLLMSKVGSLLTEPAAREQLAQSIWSVAKELPEATLRNAGYLDDAVKATHTVEGLMNIVHDNATVLKGVSRAVGEAVDGYRELSAQDAQLARTDPKAYRQKSATAAAKNTEIVVREVFVGVAGEAAGVVSKAATGKVLSGLRGLVSTTAPAVEVIEGSASALAGEVGLAEAERRLTLAESLRKTVQELPYGTVLDHAALAERAGFRTSDVEAIEQVIADVKKLYGVDLEIVARPSEALSVGIDGTGKREFVKQKAIGALDQILGGEPSFAGRCSVYEPKIPSEEVLVALEQRQPTIRAQLQERAAAQRELYADYHIAPTDPNYGKSLRFLVDESAKPQYAKDGITVLVGRPGNPLPKGVRYLEQLKDPEFLAKNGLSEQQAAALHEELSGFNAAGKRTGAGYPDAYRTKIVAETKNGTTTFSDGLRGKPIISDLDLQAVRPVDGVWPAGRRSQVEQYVKNRLGKLGTFPGHLWSDSAIDLSADYFEKAAEFELTHASLEVADQAAESVARRFEVMARLTDEAATALEPSIAALKREGRTEAAQALVGKREALIAKAKAFRKNTAKELKRKYPPGQKGISFTASGARVSGGTSGR